MIINASAHNQIAPQADCARNALPLLYSLSSWPWIVFLFAAPSVSLKNVSFSYSEREMREYIQRMPGMLKYPLLT